ncbi:hypothetical protein BOX37_02110 [Nocardia mangyaensis]|uniref:Protein-glutamine gamma-glutamyltransferase-like C-terminal domain-containing protein n=1 Tax=Nocardia mangyaensis TaxID=2213200 RepID=A0A1J0VLS4_9NOCA|nr:DUF4129 domain-containing protein [Nocardia mangyaensis]APE32959.1 hypothetical protein BOX37_02110 [Nocardia mangyaensis]
MNQPIPRAVVVIALIVAATIALQGTLPGAGEASNSTPSPLLVAVMPVLLLVSIVILVAGVIASQHRLPLAMPQAERDELPQVQWRKLALLVPFSIAVVALVFAGGVTALFLLPGARPMRPAAETLPEGSGPVPTPTGAPAPDPTAGPTQLTGTALLIAAVLAIVLIAVALFGLIVVAVAARREPAPAAPELPDATPDEVDSLTRAAEMGLAAMNAPGQDPRTAIIACYVAMERGLSSDRAARPQASDTPMEVLARAFESGVLHDASARELVALFEEARFSPHSMLEWQRMRAEQLLRIVLTDLQRRLVPA